MFRATTTILCAAAALTVGGCDMVKLTTNTTSKVLAKAQPSMQQEADYELARAAIPGSLKTVEGFWVANPSNERLTSILAEGYCQYASGFVEDEWEVATLERDFDKAAELSTRATRFFTRCMNYGLMLLGDDWQAGIFGDLQTARSLVASAGRSDRHGLKWAAIGLAGTINHNRDNIDIVAHLPKVLLMLERVVEIDDEHPPESAAARALVHTALGMMHTSRGRALGGDPERGELHFSRALELTDGKYLLPKVLYARNYGVTVQDPELFRATLVEVLETDPAIWPDQRLANEIAHRRATRYLQNEKEWF
jgi:hypothetical protein